VKLIHILFGGPDRWLSAGGKVWRFEDHPQCGPVVLTVKTGEVATTQPPESSPFWTHASAWYQQGKRTMTSGNKTWCVYETELQAKRKAARTTPSERQEQ
jgi:hypothetical protein